MRNGIGIVLTLLCLVIMPEGAAASAPVSVPVSHDQDGLAYAAGRVLSATHTKHGPIVVSQRLVAGGPDGVLATIARVHPSSPELAVSLAANAGGFVLAARDQRHTDDECVCNVVNQGEVVVRGSYEGALQTVVRCKPPAGLAKTDLLAAAGTSAFAFGGASCGTTAPVETIAADGTVAPVGGAPLPSNGFPYALSLAEPFLAVGTTAQGTTAKDVRVVDTRDGSHRDLKPPPRADAGSAAVQSDGTIVLGPVDNSATPPHPFVWSPGAAAARVLSGVSIQPFDGFVAAGGRLLFTPRTPIGGRLGVGLIGLDGSGLSVVGAPGAGAGRQPLALDGTTAVFTGESCAGGTTLVTVVDLADTTPATRPLGCPVQYRRDPLSFSRAGKGKLSVACPNGCSVRLDLDLDLDPKQVRRRELRRYVHRIADSSFATGKLHLPPGAGFRRVQVKLTRAAVALLRRYHRRVRVTPQLRFTADGPERAGPAPHLVAKLRAG